MPMLHLFFFHFYFNQVISIKGLALALALVRFENHTREHFQHHYWVIRLQFYFR